MSEVPATVTPLTRDETATQFLAAYRAAFGADPDRNRAELLLALVWIENANGAAIIRNNWGNLASSGTSGDYWRPGWYDLEAVEAMPEGPKKARYLDLHARMLAHAAPSAFSAWPTQEVGARKWLELLQKPGMRQVLDAASSGDAERFARAIHASRYCPDPECLNAGPSYARARDQIRAAGYFATLKKKVQAVEELPGLWFFFWGLALSRRTCGHDGHGVEQLSAAGEA